MRQPPALHAVVTALLAVLPTALAGMYTKSSGVINLNAQSYERLTAGSNYTWIIEFYAPWCGHCQNLKPAYEKSAQNLKGLAKVAAVDCDEDANKQFCGAMGVQGFPTLKILRPSKTPGSKPSVEDYRGPRTAKGISEAVADNINNHVSRLTEKNLDDFLATEKPKFVLFTEKGTTSALLRSIAIDYLGIITVGQIRSKEKVAVDRFGVTKFPTLLLFPGKDNTEDPVVFEGDLSKDGLLEFLSQIGPPNRDPASAIVKPSNPKDAKTKSPKSEKTSESSTGSSTKSTASPTPDAISVNAIRTRKELEDECLRPKSGTCILALVPAEASEEGDKLLASLSKLNSKYVHGKRHLFPFFSVPSNLEGLAALRDSLELKTGVELIIMNARRGWWRRYEGDFSMESAEAWIDAIRMGEGKKSELPDGVIVSKNDNTAEQSSEEPIIGTAGEPKTASPDQRTEKVEHEEL